MARKKPRRARAVRRKESHSLEKGMKNFGEEMEALGKRLESRAEHRGLKCESWWHRTFGLAGPFLSSILGIVILALGIWIVNFANMPIGSSFLANVSSFLTSNLGLFFLIILLFSYASYFSRHHPQGYRPFSPLGAAAGLTIAFWIVMNAIIIANFSIANPTIAFISYWIGQLLPVIFGVSVFVGYAILVAKISVEKQEPAVAGRRGAPSFQKAAMARREHPGRHEKEIPRLYRSGRDKILGGVCGGLGEYFRIDPVIIRLIFVILAFAWGFGFLLYLISWIIIPRNPEHKWDR